MFLSKVRDTIVGIKDDLGISYEKDRLSIEGLQHAEAVERMKMLQLHSDAIEAFDQGNMVMQSVEPMGGLYELSDDQKTKKDQPVKTDLQN